VRIDLHGSRHASHEADAIRHLIDVDTHRHALRKPHPSEDRIYRGEACLIRLRVRDVDAIGDGLKVRIGQRRGPLPIPRRLTVILGFFAPDTMSRRA
jgi:hypothetical protein